MALYNHWFHLYWSCLLCGGLSTGLFCIIGPVCGGLSTGLFCITGPLLKTGYYA